MNLVAVIEIGILVVLGLGILTQMILPLWQNTPLFPIFRAERRLEAEIRDLEGKEREDALRREIHDRKAGGPPALPKPEEKA